MCLTIDQRRHPNLKPIKLDKDLIVSKDLSNKDSIIFNKLSCWIRICCNFVTPYRHKPIHFLFGKCVLRAKLDEPKTDNRFIRWYNTKFYIIDKGIHAYTIQHAGMHPAIIPKGTLVYYGLYDDIVAEKLIIYKDKEKWQQLK